MSRPTLTALAAALLLVLVPAALTGTATAAGDNDRPTRTTLHPERLPRGANTPLLHTEEDTIVDGTRRVRVRGFGSVWILGRVGTSYVVHTRPREDPGRYQVLLVRRDGSRRVLHRFDDMTAPVLSADGTRLALVRPVRPGATVIRVVRTRTGQLVRERSFPSYGIEVSDYGLRRMVFGGLDNKTYWWDPVMNRLRLLVARPAWADISADRLVVWTGDPAVDYFSCQKVVRLTRPEVRLWRSCKEAAGPFSPNGRRMLTTFIHTDGLGPSYYRVRQTDGTVLRTYRPPSFFGFAVWEGNRRLLLQPIGPDHIAAVRCVVAPGGTCRRASRLYPGFGESPDPPWSMNWSFPDP